MKFRCRHENLLHAHCLFVYDDDLHIITPRLYVLRELVELYRVRHSAEPCPATIIIRILRQLCIALDYLNKVGIVHRFVYLLSFCCQRRSIPEMFNPTISSLRGTVRLSSVILVNPVQLLKNLLVLLLLASSNSWPLRSSITSLFKREAIV